MKLYQESQELVWSEFS